MDDSDADDNNDDSQEPEEEEEEGDVQQGTTASDAVLAIHAVASLDSLFGLREIGREALCWQLSSAKPGNGVEQIRDQTTDTYWQSDGVSQPHWIQVHFARRVAISHVCLYLDYSLDESYTPKHISVQVGMTTQDFIPAIYPTSTVAELNDPVGWCIIPLMAPPDPLDFEEEGGGEEPAIRRVVRTHMIRISVLSMHQNGRDTHVRQVQLYGPRTAGMLSALQVADNDSQLSGMGDEPAKRHELDEDFSTVPMSQFSVVR